MHTRSAFHRISTLTFVAALLLIGMPRPTSAAGEENAAVARHRGVTINGRPLTQLVSATADAGSAFLLAGLLEQDACSGSCAARQ